MIKIIKITAVAGAVLICAALSAHFTKTYITDVGNREKTLAELIIDGEAAKALDDAARQKEEEIGKTAVIVTTTAPVTTQTEKVVEADADVTDIPVTTTVTSAPTETTTAVTYAPIVTDYKIGGLIDTSQPPKSVKTLLTLAAQEQQILTDYLIEHYFLNGFIYADIETHPDVKARKKAAADMESASTQTVNMIMAELDLSAPMKILDADFDALIAKVSDVEAGFHAAYDNETLSDDNMRKLYDGSISYFAQLKSSLTAIKQVQTDYKNAANALLAAGLAAKALTSTVIPEIMNILESSFDLVEASQPIFLENTTGVTLLTRDEVRAILINPGYIL
jgi:hypothetical protein